MARLPAREPYVEVQLHTTLHHYEASLATWAVHYYAGYFTNNSVGPSCEACMWFVTAPEVPGEMLLEITGTHAVPPPWTTPRETWYSYRVHAIDADASMGYSVTNMPTYIRFANKEIQNSTEYLFTFYCDTVWLCIEERRDAYLSLFYGLDLPEGYTAIPAK